MTVRTRATGGTYAKRRASLTSVLVSIIVAACGGGGGGGGGDDSASSGLVARDDSGTLQQNSGYLPIYPTQNDTFGDAGPGDVGLVIVEQPNNGTATVYNRDRENDPTDDRINYRPDSYFTGTDSLVYQIEDGNGNTARATLHVTVEPAPEGALKWAEIHVGSDIAPAIGPNGYIHIFSGQDRDEYMHALAMRPNGVEVWSDTTCWQNFGMGPAVSSDGRLFVSCGDSVYVYESSDGSELDGWGTGSGNGGSTGYPAVDANGTVYVIADGALHALDSSHNSKWSFHPDDVAQVDLGLSALIDSPVIAADGTVYVKDNNGNVIAVTPYGSYDWSYRADVGIYGALAINSDGQIIFGAGDMLHVLNADGSLASQLQLLGSLTADVAIAEDGTIYVPTTPDSWGEPPYYLEALNPDGTRKWRYQADRLFGSPALAADGTIFVGSDGRQLRAINDDGSLRWSFEPPIDTARRSLRAPAIGPDGTVYAAYTSGNHLEGNRLYAIQGTAPLMDSAWPRARQNNMGTGQARLFDTDGDGVNDVRDNCPDTANADQLDQDGDGTGNACDLDSDGDGLSDAEEANLGTDSLDTDSDGDGVPDGDEVNDHGSDPLNVDTDGDGLEDGTEVNDLGTDPVLADTDGDGLDDAEEVNTLGTDPLSADTDQDGFADDEEVAGSSDPTSGASWPSGGLQWSGARSTLARPAIDASGRIYARDANGYYVRVFLPDGTLVDQLQSYESYSTFALDDAGILYQGGNEGGYYALDSGDNTNVWSYMHSSGFYASAQGPAISADGKVVFGASQVGVLAFNRADGSLAWSFPASGDRFVSSTPAIASDGTIYIGASDTTLHALNPDGTLRWSYGSGGGTKSSPAIAADGTIYIGSYDGSLHAVNPDGTGRWSFATGAGVGTTPAIDDNGNVYFGSEDGVFYALRPDGSALWTYDIGSPIQSSAALAADGTVYFAADDGRAYALNADGSLKWSYDADAGSPGGVRMGSPVIGADGTVYIGSENGLLALKLGSSPRMDSAWPSFGRDLRGTRRQ